MAHIPQRPSKSNLSILLQNSSKHATTLKPRSGIYHKTPSTLDHTRLLSRAKLHLQAIPHRIPTKSIPRHAQAVIDSERRITISLFVSTDNYAARRRPSYVALPKLPGIDENDVYPPLPPLPVVAHPMVRTKARRPRPRFRDTENNTPCVLWNMNCTCNISNFRPQDFIYIAIIAIRNQDSDRRWRIIRDP